MNANVFFSLLVNGFAMGMVYALMAMGIILLIRAVGVLNFAQGDLLMLGAYVSCALIVDVKLPLLAMIPVALVLFAAIGLLFMVAIYFPLRNANYPSAIIIATMGAAIVIKEMVQLVWGSLPRSLPPLILDRTTGGGKLLKIGSVTLQWQFVLTILVGGIMIFLVFTLFDRLYAGRMMQAAAQNKYAAELVGIPTTLTIAVTYIIAISLSSIGGFMVAPMFTVNITLGTLQLRSFAGVIIGGMGNIKGAIIGSILIGLIESFSTVKYSSYKDAVIFLVLILFLLVRPQGIFGEKISDKA